MIPKAFLAFKRIFFLLLGFLNFGHGSFAQSKIQDSLQVQRQDTGILQPKVNFEVDYMETGVHIFSLESPYQTVLSFLYNLKEENWHPDSAAITLNINNPEGQLAQEKAIKLKEFMDGSGYFIDVDAIPRSVGYTDSSTRLQRYVLTSAEPDIFLYKKSRGWVFSWTTVQAIDKLHAKIYPFGTMKWLPKWSQQRFLGLRLWQFLGVILFIVFTYLFHKLLTKILGTLLESTLQRFVRQEKALEFFMKVARPMSLLILFSTLASLYPALQFSLDVNRWVINAFRVVIPVYVMMIVMQLVNLVMMYFQQKAAASKSTFDDQLVPLLRNILKGIVVVTTIIFIVQRLAIDITALLGGVAVGTLAFALAAQDTIKNLFGSLVIFIDRPFQIGDWIVVGDVEGVVEEVSVRSTRIRTFANSLISIPNGTIAAGTINNMGARSYRRFTTRVRLHYSTPPELISLYVEGIREIVRNHPTIRKDSFEVHFDTMDDDSLQILIYVFFVAPNWTKELEGRQALLIAIIELASCIGVNFAFPKQVINIGTNPPSPEETKGELPGADAIRLTMKEFIAGYKQKMQEGTGPNLPEIGSSEVRNRH